MRGSVLAAATSLIGNVTVVSTQRGRGYVAPVPAGGGQLGHLSPGGTIDIYVGGYPTHVIIDLFAVVS